MLEGKIEKSCTGWATRRKWWSRKFVSPAQRSVPDRVFGKAGRVIWVEFKATDKEPTDLQAEEHTKMRAVGLDVRWYNSIEAFKADFEPINAELDNAIAKCDRLDNPQWKATAHPTVRRVEQPKRPVPRKASRRKRSETVEGLAGPFRELEDLSSVEFEEWLLKS